MTPTSVSRVQPPILPGQEELIRRLLSDTPLLKDDDTDEESPPNVESPQVTTDPSFLTAANAYSLL